MQTVHFDEFFTGYSYLEDLDLSFTVRRRWRLAVLAEARYAHNPSTARHLDSFGFGRIEIVNRLHFVRKHDLSLPLCWLAIAARLAMTLSHAAMHLDSDSARRACGNIAEIVTSLIPSEFAIQAFIRLARGRTSSQLRILACAYACNPNHGSEEGVGWGWVKAIAQTHEIWALTDSRHRIDIERQAAGERDGCHNLRFVYVPRAPMAQA